jgi:hypothetical protein
VNWIFTRVCPDSVLPVFLSNFRGIGAAFAAVYGSVFYPFKEKGSHITRVTQLSMQVLLKKSDTSRDIECTLCGQGFRAYWERSSTDERETVRTRILSELRGHHAAESVDTASAHPDTPFNLPSWSGSPQFSGAALLGGLSGMHRPHRPTSK